MRTLHLDEDLYAEIVRIARNTFPDECCGLLEGREIEDGWRALALHPARNLAVDPARHFLIDPQVHFDLLRALRGTDRRIIGCFHSHPNGLPLPSEKDAAEAIESDFVWVIAGGSAEVTCLTAFVYSAVSGKFAPLTLTK